jgi:hypothetical protein
VGGGGIFYRNLLRSSFISDLRCGLWFFSGQMANISGGSWSWIDPVTVARISAKTHSLPPPHLCPRNLPKFFAILANYFCQLYRMYLCWNLAIQIHFFKYCGAEVARSRIILGGRRWFRNATYSSGSDGSFNVVSLEPHQKLTEKLAPKIEKMSF